MYDRDGYSEPTSSYADYGLEEESSGGKAARAAKKILPILVLLLVIAGAGWFFYDMFVGSIRNITITVKNAEGEPLRDSSIKIYTAGGEELFRSAGQASHSTELRKGTYNADVTAGGYELKRGQQITVDEKDTIPIVLEKNYRLEIDGIENTFPKSIILGQTLQAPMVVKNNGKGVVDAEFVFEGDIEKLGIIVIPTPLSIPPQGEATAILEIKPQGLQLEQKTGDTLKGSVRVKYVLKKESLETKVYPTPILELREIDFGRLKAGTSGFDKDITVRNKSAFPVTGLLLSIEITNAPLNKPSEVLKWFKFTEIANTENPTQVEILEIQKSGIAEKKLRVDIPITAKKEVISGNLVLSASFLGENKKKPLTIEVSEEANIGLRALPRPGKISIRWLEEQGKYEEKPMVVEFTNSGALSINNILLSVKNSATCHVGWLRIAEQTISELAPKQSRELTLFASSPVSQRGNESTMNCKLRYKYDNPTPLGPSFFEQEIEGFIAITPLPE